MKKIEGKNGLHLYAQKGGVTMKPNISSISRNVVFKGRIADIVHKVISVNEGGLEYEIVQRSPIVVIVPIVDSGEFIIIKQYRAAIDREIWEFPAGTIEDKECILDAARRELKEETGYYALKVEFVGFFYAAPHFSDEKTFICLATKLSQGETNLQEKEHISTELFTESELFTKYHNKEILDSRTLIAYHVLKYDLHDILTKL